MFVVKFIANKNIYNSYFLLNFLRRSIQMEKLKPKLFSVMKQYSKEQFVKDVIAGIIVAIIALPLSIALAIASGVNPEQGLYTAIIAGFFISFLGGSRVQIGGPTAAFVTIIYGIILSLSCQAIFKTFLYFLTFCGMIDVLYGKIITFYINIICL